MYFLSNIRFLVESGDKHKSIRSLTLELGVSEASFSNMQKRKTNPSVEVANKCAKIFNVTIDDILNNDLRDKTIKENIPTYKLELDSLFSKLDTREQKAVIKLMKELTDK